MVDISFSGATTELLKGIIGNKTVRSINEQGRSYVLKFQETSLLQDFQHLSRVIRRFDFVEGSDDYTVLVDQIGGPYNSHRNLTGIFFFHTS